MSTVVAIALLTSALATAAPNASVSRPATQTQDASLSYVSESLLPVGIFYGMTAVDNRPLILDQRENARITSGLRTIFYACPNEPRSAASSRLSFNFQAGQTYELVCRAGQPAEIRAAERC